MKEIWKDVVDYENLYQISNLGNLRTFNHYGSGRIAIMKPAKDKKGYLRTSLTKNRKLKTIKYHREVAKAFIPNPKNKPQINHINGIKQDNRVENLEWCTNSENAKHAFKNGLESNKGSKNPYSILTEQKVLEIRSKYIPFHYTRKMLAEEYGVKVGTIKGIVSLSTWNHI